MPEPLPATRRLLHDGWRFRHADAGTEADPWLPAAVPGCVHTDLYANGVIDDPFYRDHEARVQWIGERDWVYETILQADDALLGRGHVELAFEGLDTHAVVEVNGAAVLQADNMFRRWRADVRDALRPGPNALRVTFRSALDVGLQRLRRLGRPLPAVNDQADDKVSVFSRKAPYHFGWDWGPRFVTCGVWRPVALEVWDAATLRDVHLVQQTLTDARAVLQARLTIEADAALDAELVARSPDGAFPEVRHTAALRPGPQRVDLDLTIPNPERWWPNGLGEQPLYTVEVELRVGGRALERRSLRIGLRTIELRQEDDRWGRSFAFVVNGVPVFARGANWIPADSFLTRVDEPAYRRLLTAACDVHMNMVRVWGGGVYEDDAFYDLCDELGLLVWQDFMFACSMYPGDDAFTANVVAEAEDVLRRLRNHPSLALWCGNNEIETAWQSWGWKWKYPWAIWRDYRRLFHDILPRLCAAHDPSRPYWRSSPSSDGLARANDPRYGDVHYWGVWHNEEPFEAYTEQAPRFMSEYGFQSFPLLPTVASYTAPGDRRIDSPVMAAHQRHPRGNELIRNYTARRFPLPEKFADQLYMSQILQAEAIRIGTEHLRRIRPRCMGALYWQLNDCWPVASWSSIDYAGRWKALHYAARRFFADVLLSPHVEQGALHWTVVSDRARSLRGVLRVQLLDVRGHVLAEQEIHAALPPQSSRILLRLPLDALLEGRDPRAVFVYGALEVGGRTASTNRHFFVPENEFRLPCPKIEVAAAPDPGGLRLTVRSNVLARHVLLAYEEAEGFFTDNFFDVHPGAPVELVFRSEEVLEAGSFRGGLAVRSLGDVG